MNDSDFLLIIGIICRRKKYELINNYKNRYELYENRYELYKLLLMSDNDFDFLLLFFEM